MKSERLFYLDCVRAIAILLIIISHYNVHLIRIVSDNYVFFNPQIASGIGVSLFIILSGSSLIISTENNFSILNFYKKRFFAIFPLFYITYLFWFVALLLIFKEYRFADRNPFAFLFTILGLDGFFLYNIKTYYLVGEWFLGLILILYLLFPVVRYFYYKNKICTLIVSFIICLTTYYFYNLDMSIIRFPPIRLFEFVFGAAFIFEFKKFTNKSNNILLVSSIILLTLIFIFKVQSILLVQKILLGIIYFTLIVSSTHLITNTTIKNLVNFLSRYSYGAFLFHHIFIVKFIYINKQYISSIEISILMFFVSIIIIYFASYILTNLSDFCLKKTLHINSSLITRYKL
jgi:peptidoglycan/LPS O-acetylase OafA/YrhL